MAEQAAQHARNAQYNEYNHYTLEEMAAAILGALPQKQKENAPDDQVGKESSRIGIITTIIEEASKVMQLSPEILTQNNGGNPDTSPRHKYGVLLAVEVMDKAHVPAQQIANTFSTDKREISASLREFEHYKYIKLGTPYMPKKYLHKDEAVANITEKPTPVGDAEAIDKEKDAEIARTTRTLESRVVEESPEKVPNPPSDRPLPSPRTIEEIKTRFKMEVQRGSSAYKHLGGAKAVVTEICNSYNINPEHVKETPLTEPAMEAAVAIAYCLVEKEGVEVIGVWQLLDTDRDAVEEYVRIGRIIMGEDPKKI